MYTDDYEENENEERNEETYKEPKSSKNYLKIIIIVILFIVLLALLYFVFKGKFTVSKEEDKYVLSIYPETIIVPLGKNQNISYEVRKNGIIVPEAAVRLTVVDETVASVDNTILTGLKYGKTSVTATYINPDGKSFQETKDITVADGDPNVMISNVTFPEGDLQMPFNGTYNINLGINPPNGYIENKTFTSSNPNVVVVDNSGSVTAISEGEAVITIDINNGQFTKEIMVYVSKDSEISKIVISPTDIKINNPISKIIVGETANLKYTVTPSNASTDNIKWISSNEKVITVDYRGKVKAIKEGNATIKVQTANNLSDSFDVVVETKIKEVTDISLPVEELYLTLGESQMLVPVITPYDAENKTLTYTIDNPMVATIIPSIDTSSLTITPLSSGTAIITITANDGKVVKTLTILVPEATPEPGGSGGGGSSCASCKNKNCDAGKYCQCGKCYECPAGNYCYNNQKTACEAGKGSVPNSKSYQDCSACEKGFYSTGDGKGCVACPKGTTTKSVGSKSIDACVGDSTTITAPCCVTEKSGTKTTINDISGCKQAAIGGASVVSGACTKITSCKLGQYIDAAGKCSTCPQGKYCKDGKKTYNCPAGSGAATGAIYGANCKKCAEGYISAAGAPCKKCSSGKSNSARTACIS